LLNAVTANVSLDKQQCKWLAQNRLVHAVPFRRSVTVPTVSHCAYFLWAAAANMMKVSQCSPC